MSTRWTLTSLAAALVLLLTTLRGNADDLAPTPNVARLLAEFQVPRDADELLLPVTFRGDRYLFILDTGSDLTIFDSCFRPHLGNAIRTSRAKTPSGEMRVDLFPSPSARLGELNMQNALPVICTDLSQVREVTGHEVYGMIGMGFLRDHVLKLDLDRSIVSFLRSAPPESGQPVRIFYRSLHPRVTADVAGVIADFTVDTGCSQSGNIETSIFDQLTDRQHVRAIGLTQSATLSGIKDWRNGRVTSVSLNGFTHRDLVLTEAQDNQLGLAYLSRYVVTLDFPNATMYLNPGKRFDRPDRRDMSGLHLLRSENTVVVHSVDAGSPAGRAE